jgi:hypothetical protein
MLDYEQQFIVVRWITEWPLGTKQFGKLKIAGVRHVIH